MEHDRVEELAIFRREEDKIAQMTEALSTCQNLTTNMMSILESFESKLTSLEDTMIPIHQKTQILSNAQRNIDLTAREMEKVVENHLVAVEDDDIVNQRSLTLDWRAYLDWVNRLNNGIFFFQDHLTFKNAEKYIRKLKEKLKRAMQECQEEFGRLMASNTNPIELTQTGWPLDPNFELIPANLVERLSLIASQMDRTQDRSFLDILRDQRSAALKESLKKVVHDNHPSSAWSGPLASFGAIANSSNINTREGDKKSADLMSRSSAIYNGSGRSTNATDMKVGRYTKGKHYFIFYLKFFLKLLQLELALYSRILSHTTLTQHEFDDAFMQMVDEKVLEYFNKHATKAIKERGPNRILILLDILDNINQSLVAFREVLKRRGGDSFADIAINSGLNGYQEDQFELLLDLRRKTTAACKKAIQEYIDYVSSADHKSKQHIKDGNVSPLTTETLNYLKRLYQYSETLDAIPKARILDDVKDQGSDMPALTIITLRILKALDENLEKKARAFKLVPLQYIFLLNNRHHVLKYVKSSDCRVDDAFITRYNWLIQTAREDYALASWQKALGFINLDEARQLKAKSLNGMTKQLKTKIKAKFSGFNAAFDHLYDTQRQFSVPDSVMRSQLRNDNVKAVIERYTIFLDIFADVPFATNAGKYKKYPVNILERCLNTFFDEEGG